MRIGVLARGEPDEIEWVRRLGFRSWEWVRFEDSAAGPDVADWRAAARGILDRCEALDIRISAIGAQYANPLDPHQTGPARAVFRRAIEVASELGVPTVSGFPGAVVETVRDERGGHPVYRPFEDFIPRMLEFWDPIAAFAADHGVRIAFEHCPQGAYHLPIMGYNMLAQPAMWERVFAASRHENLGIEWDPSHLVCQMIDPVENVQRFGSRIFHVHAKDARLDRRLMATYGICHPGVAEHRFPGFGDSDWPEIVHALVRAGYDSDLNIEGWHDPVFRDHDDPGEIGPLTGRKLEEDGLRVARELLERLVPHDATS